MNNKKGFTLIELMVVMAIIGILAATAIVNFGKNEDRDVRQEKDRLTSFLREVQNKALAGEKVSGVSGKVCGFGVQLASPSTFQTFYVAAPNLDTVCQTYINSGGWTANNYDSEFSLNNNVTVSGVITTSNKIFFLEPVGTVYSDNSTSVGFPITINLTKAGVSIPAYINQSGRIY